MQLLASLVVVLPLVQSVQRPVLEFPEAGLDDPAAYEGYSTRFFRDARRNAVQIYVDGRSGRVVHVFADATNASAAFTVRDTVGAPAAVTWGGPGAEAGGDGGRRSLRYRLATERGPLEIGWFLLGTMRQERDFQYQQWHRRPYGRPPFILAELAELIEALERLPPAEGARHLSLLNATSIDEVRARLQPRVTLTENDTAWIAVATHTSLDGRNEMTLAIAGDARVSTASLVGEVLSVRARRDTVLWFDVTAATDGNALTPLDRGVIFNEAFEGFYTRQRRLADSVRRTLPPTEQVRDPRITALRRLDREILGLELLSTEEKLLASMPNYATYFGRDMMMAALMLEPVVSVDVEEHVIASVLRKVAPPGDVSHEEALGGQAIRENAAEYAALIGAWEEARGGDPARAVEMLAQARTLLADLQAVRENYRMIDDDFQLAVLVGRYLSRADVPAERKRRFLGEVGPGGAPRLDALWRNLALVAELARPYAEQPTATNLVGFRYRDDRGWLPGSWRDSRAGYGNGRFAMDVNVVWVPEALEALQVIRQSLAALEVPVDDAVARVPRDAAALDVYLRDPATLRSAVATWRGARRHFVVRLDPDAVRQRVTARLQALPDAERAFWQPRLQPAGVEGLSILALALDSAGRPIAAVNTDVATDFFLGDYTDQIVRGTTDPADVEALLDAVTRAYPVGLFVDGLGPVIVNDAYASTGVQERFGEDLYHSPRVVWGREVNLLLLGLARQIQAAYDTGGRLRNDTEALRSYVATLRRALEMTQRAVEASGLRHNELWSYRIDDGTLSPARYGTSSDIQLWNLTDLAVRFALERLPRP